MFILGALMIITIIVVGIALLIFSLGGTLLVIIGSDLIVAIGIIWLLFKLRNRGA